MGKVELYINETLERKGAMLFSLIDPIDYKDGGAAVKTATETVRGGADLVLLGGSIGVQGGILDRVARAIKDEIDVPLVIFPGNIGTITTNVDAIYFMSLLNSRNPYWITQAQTLAAPVIKKAGIEPLPVGYIVVPARRNGGLGRGHKLRAQGEADDSGRAGDRRGVHGEQDNNHRHRIQSAGAGLRARARRR